MASDDDSGSNAARCAAAEECPADTDDEPATTVESVSGRRGTSGTRATPFGAGLICVGVLTLVSSWYAPSVRGLLVAVGSISVFGGFLAVYLDTDQLLRGDIGRDIYTVTERNESALAAFYGLSTERVYVPTDEGVVLFVPPDADAQIPPAAHLTPPQFPGGCQEGMTLLPRGRPLLEDVQATLVEPLSDDPATLAEQIEDGLTDTLEVARRAEWTLDSAGGRLDVRLDAAVFPPGFDTPPASFTAVALASGLQVTIVMEIEPDGSDSYTVTCHWNPDSVPATR